LNRAKDIRRRVCAKSGKANTAGEEGVHTHIALGWGGKRLFREQLCAFQMRAKSESSTIRDFFLGKTLLLFTLKYVIFSTENKMRQIDAILPAIIGAT